MRNGSPLWNKKRPARHQTLKVQPEIQESVCQSPSFSEGAGSVNSRPSFCASRSLFNHAVHSPVTSSRPSSRIALSRLSLIRRAITIMTSHQASMNMAIATAALMPCPIATAVSIRESESATPISYHSVNPHTHVAMSTDSTRYLASWSRNTLQHLPALVCPYASTQGVRVSRI